MFGVPSDHTGDPDPNRYFTLLSADIVVKRPEAWGLLWDFEALRGCVREMPQDGPLQNKAGYVANEVGPSVVCFRNCKHQAAGGRCWSLTRPLLEHAIFLRL